MKPDNPQCSVRIYPSGSVFSGQRCSKRGKVVHTDGRWYCGVHDPEVVEARRAARQEKYNKAYQEALARREAPYNKIKELIVEIEQRERGEQASRVLVELCREFVKRVDTGEVRSKRTYTKMKKALAAYDCISLEQKRVK